MKVFIKQSLTWSTPLLATIMLLRDLRRKILLWSVMCNSLTLIVWWIYESIEYHHLEELLKTLSKPVFPLIKFIVYRSIEKCTAQITSEGTPRAGDPTKSSLWCRMISVNAPNTQPPPLPNPIIISPCSKYPSKYHYRQHANIIYNININISRR